MARGKRVEAAWLILCLLLVGNISHCEARALRRSRRNSLLNALFKLNFIKTVEPTQLPPNPSSDGAAASVAAAAAAGSRDGTTNAPFCVNPPNSPSTPPFTSTPSSTPFIPEQPPPLPPITPTPPSFEPSPPEGTTPTPTSPTASMPGPPQGASSPPESSVPSPIFVVPSPPNYAPSPPESGPGGGSGGGGGGGGGGGFLPPIVYPAPLAPPEAPGAEARWCVAKPAVPDPIIQEAMDYACGSGAECKSIQPSGACYQPNTVLAHASYAFNSYWQMTKASGGTCDFGGTATIVTSDPSYEKCAFNLL